MGGENQGRGLGVAVARTATAVALLVVGLLIAAPARAQDADVGRQVEAVRELMKEGYVVVAPEYRGSTGYGREYREAIDYGDSVLARESRAEIYRFLARHLKK